MISCIIVDDEPHYIETIEEYVQKTLFLQLRGSFTNPRLALEYVYENPVQLAILDIDMPQMRGNELMKLLHQSTNTKVIFSTAYSNYAIEGYENDVIDYLLKPYDFDRFFKSACKAKTLFENTGQYITPSLFVKGAEKNQQIRITLAEINFIESNGHYTTIHTATQKYTDNRSLKELESLLPPKQFVRIHKSIIVHLDKVLQVTNTDVTLNNRQVLALGKGFREGLNKLLGI
jgi:DNA-binding LytR/AlgR family response regulator